MEVKSEIVMKPKELFLNESEICRMMLRQKILTLCVCVCVYIFFFVFSRAAPIPCGGSQARGPIGAVTTRIQHSHSKVGYKRHLQPTPQLTAMLEPQPTEQGQGSNPQPHGS